MLPRLLCVRKIFDVEDVVRYAHFLLPELAVLSSKLSNRKIRIYHTEGLPISLFLGGYWSHCVYPAVNQLPSASEIVGVARTVNSDKIFQHC